MRLISLLAVEFEIAAGWHADARGALKAVKDSPVPERAKAINARSKVWSALKPVLDKVSSGKCWYCESKQARSDKAVDHFRPKNRVAESATGDGYWWLAFDWQNYRYSCTYCNSHRSLSETSGGKQDHFPLFDEAQRGQPEASSVDLNRGERPKLLDPTRLEDVTLLTFETGDGSVAPACKQEDDPIGYERAKMSIELYHLREPGLQRARFMKMLEVRERLRAAEKLEKADETYQNTVALIAGSISREAEYSAAARAMLKGLRGQSPLAQVILENVG